MEYLTTQFKDMTTEGKLAYVSRKFDYDRHSCKGLVDKGTKQPAGYMKGGRWYVDIQGTPIETYKVALLLNHGSWIG